MNFQHTPGPWHWEGHNLYPTDPNPEISAVHTILSEYGAWGFAFSDPKQTGVESAANYRAIAAVPQLMDALAAALAVLTPRGPLRSLTSPESVAFFKLRDALAAATGTGTHEPERMAA
ncbi:hypothetical protein [Ralstonia insidiosa]|uniref:Uncharacterized protein n=1 Tax=Ralstonia insidiosa TaxID=190721 RepID=A0A848NXK2_9RALS|nr:hypothetical protein [Ralstonia insidiosa]NMV37214.1 hypothetical protein [Ralstonia insidiosa]